MSAIASPSNRREVTSTPAVFFDADFKTFRLYAGKTLYAFCITPELTLEHLYWGTSLPPGFDLRYLSQSTRNAHFNTVEAAPDRFGGRIIIGTETLEEVMKTYKESKTASLDESSAFYKRRLENYSWRILNKATQAGKAAPTMLDLDDGNQWWKTGRSFITPMSPSASSKKAADDSNHGGGRRRSATNPPEVRNRKPSIDGFRSDSADDYENTSQITQHSSVSKPQSTLDLPFVRKNRRNSKQHLHKHRQTFERTTGKMGKGLLCCEYSDHGTGDYRSPSFMVVDNSNGSSISPLRYKRHAIYRGKLPMPDSMPAIRCLHEDEASTLVVTMADSITGLEVDLVYGKRTYLHYLSGVHDAELVSIICLSQLRCTTTTSSHGAQCFAT